MNRLPISIDEFGRLLRCCRPPNGWGNTLAVAHSGGADSTCLLYLFHCWLSQRSEQDGPAKLLSISVDHALQRGSSATADRCRRFCKSLPASFQCLRIPWSRPPFPDRPETMGSVETAARLARYRLLFEAMKDNDATVLATGHHADDNVETLLMRLARSQRTSQPMGIRRCRRWGMGSSCTSLDWVGAPGMDRWIVRPLLSVPKARILATCELHGLDYIDDPTNFQPSLTPRNLVRYWLSQRSQDRVGIEVHQPAKVHDVEQAISRLDGIGTKTFGLSREIPLAERLHATANQISRFHDRIDEEATQYLEKFAKPSPPSTILLLPHLARPTPAEDVQRAIVLRILRFVSPKPWGAPDSEASRRSSSLRRISTQLWSISQDSRRPFTAGSEVVWRPVFLDANDRMRSLVPNDVYAPQERMGWVASRQPPIARTSGPSPSIKDISSFFNDHHEFHETLWDNRFLIILKPPLLPAEIMDSCKAGIVLIVPHGRWQLPKIVWIQPKQKDVVLGGVGLNTGGVSSRLLDSEWAEFRYIRSLDPI